MKKHQPSSTAYTVLEGVLYIARHPAYSGLVSEDMEEACRRILLGSEEGRKRLSNLDSRWYKLCASVIERLLVPGITLHYVLRKRYIEDYLLRIIHDEMQVINLGAGFDPLAYRLADMFPDVGFIEIDHPNTHEIKCRALMTLENKNKNIHFLPADFTEQRLDDVLEQSSCVKSHPDTLCIIEGVLMYLGEEHVRQVFRSLKKCLDGRIRVILTASVPDAFNPFVKMYLKIKGEPFGWLCEKDSLDKFLRSMDFSLKHLADANELKKLYLQSDFKAIVHEGDYIAEAEYHSKPS